MNARVLPLPVLAAPRMSRPASACGMVARWMAVSSLKRASASPRCVASERGMSLNLRTPTREAPRPFSLDLRGATASGLVPFSGAVACQEWGKGGWGVREEAGGQRLSAAARFLGRRLARSGRAAYLDGRLQLLDLAVGHLNAADTAPATTFAAVVAPHAGVAGAVTHGRRSVVPRLSTVRRDRREQNVPARD